MGDRAFRRERPRRTAARTAAVVAATGLLAAPAAARAAGSATWTGAAPASSTYPTLGDWANAGNWNGNDAFADGDALSFEALSGCGATSACYTAEATPQPKTSTPDTLSSPSLTIGDDLPYDLLAQKFVSLTLDPPVGTAGITATPTGARLGSPSIIVPLTLGDSQQWSVTGNGAGSGALSVLSVSGAPNPLGLSLTGGASVFFTGLLQTGGLTAVGGGAATPAGNGTVAISTPASDPGTSPVTAQHVALTLGAYSGATVGVGSLSVQSSALTIGGGGPDGPGVTTAAGAVTIDSGSTTTVQLGGVGGSAGSSYGQLAAGGSVSVAGQLTLIDVAGTTAGCPADPVGSVDTLISGSSLSGRFAGLPDGAITSVTARCGGATLRYPIAIHYTPTAVTGTFVAPSATDTTVQAGASTVVSGTNATFSATVAPAAAGADLPTGSVQFLDGTTPITCGTGGALSPTSPLTATCAARLTPGTHTIQAVYGGDGAWAGSSSTTTVDVVRPLDGFPRLGRPQVRRRHVVAVPVTCIAGGGDCVVRVALDIDRTVHRGTRFVSHTVTLGQTQRTIDSGARRMVTITLNATGRRALARARHRRLTVELVLERVVSHHRYRVAGRDLVLRRAAVRRHR